MIVSVPSPPATHNEPFQARLLHCPVSVLVIAVHDIPLEEEAIVAPPAPPAMNFTPFQATQSPWSVNIPLVVALDQFIPL